MNTNANPPDWFPKAPPVLHDLPLPDSDETFDALMQCFRLTGDFVTAECLRVFTCCRPDDLVKLGWLQAATLGRWSSGWRPDGRLAEKLFVARHYTVFTNTSPQ